MNTNESKEKNYKTGITILSIVIPIAVAALFCINLRALGFDVEPLSFLPPICNHKWYYSNFTCFSSGCY